jgi:FADH2-dependent halogenase
MTVASRPPAPPYDAVVIGGGPAGAAAAAHLARHDRRVLVAERERFPRFHIGESLIPETNRHLERIGVLEKIAAEGFPVKRGAILLAGDGEHESYADFSEADGVERTTTWEVPRHRFDQVLLEHAEACGAEVSQGTRATSVAMEDDGVTLTVRSDETGERVVRARTVIDASGRDGFLAKRLKLRRFDPELRHVGVHAWYEDVEPPPAECAGDVRLISLARGGWGWLIPLDGRRTSVGVVVPRERHAQLPTESPERCLDLLLEDIPVVRPFLARARRVSEVRIEGDYSYSTRAYAGDRWLLAGDAGSFLDPVFSTGVLLALEGGIDAAEAIHRGLRDGNRQRSFAAYDRAQRRVYRFFRRYVTGFYRPEFRDLLLRPGDPLGLSKAVVTVLAGNARPSLKMRLRLELFFVMVALQRVVEVAPRLHAWGGREPEER